MKMSDTPTLCRCSTCGYTWTHGTNGSHSCIAEVVKQRDDAITFIKSLNAIKGEHARVYRARCGSFLAGVKGGAK